MASARNPFLELGALDALAGGTSPIHRLDPRAKVLAVAGFLATVASFGRYDIAGLVPFALFPALLLVLADIPGDYVLRRVLATLPFVLALAGKGWRAAVQSDRHLLNGLNVHAGHVTHAAVAADLGLPFVSTAEALAA